MAAKALFIHVPVDRVDIKDGPQSYLWLQIRDQLATNGGDKEFFEARFKMCTEASKLVNQRKIELMTITANSRSYTFQFTGRFCAQMVQGLYNIQTRTGSFSLA